MTTEANATRTRHGVYPMNAPTAPNHSADERASASHPGPMNAPATAKLHIQTTLDETMPKRHPRPTSPPIAAPPTPPQVARCVIVPTIANKVAPQIAPTTTLAAVARLIGDFRVDTVIRGIDATHFLRQSCQVIGPRPARKVRRLVMNCHHFERTTAEDRVYRLVRR